MYDEDLDDELFILSNRALKKNVTAVEITREPLDINLQLDTYNDYMDLYNVFGDQVYLISAENVLNKLRYYS